MREEEEAKDKDPLHAIDVPVLAEGHHEYRRGEEVGCSNPAQENCIHGELLSDGRQGDVNGEAMKGGKKDVRVAMISAQFLVSLSEQISILE